MARTKSPRARWRRGRGGAPGLQQACRSWPFRILLPAGLQELAVLANNGKQKHAAGARCRRTPQAPGSGDVRSFSMYARRSCCKFLTPGLSWDRRFSRVFEVQGTSNTARARCRRSAATRSEDMRRGGARSCST